MTGCKSDRRVEWFFARPSQHGFNEKGPVPGKWSQFCKPRGVLVELFAFDVELRGLPRQPLGLESIAVCKIFSAISYSVIAFSWRNALRACRSAGVITFRSNVSSLIGFSSTDSALAFTG
jgi:hypothetical protein